MKTTVFYKIVFDSKHGSLSDVHTNTLQDAKNELINLASHTGEHAEYWKSVAESARIYKVTQIEVQEMFSL